MRLNIVIFGLSITSSWGNGHATTYRALVKALSARGHRVTFLERDVDWYRDNRDLLDPPYCQALLYGALGEIPSRFGGLVRDADLVIVGSYVPGAIAIGDWVTMQAKGVTAFYDIDTPVTLARLREGRADYMSPSLIPRFDLYLSFTGGPALDRIERVYGSPRARALYCAVDPDLHAPVGSSSPTWGMGHLGTFSKDRQQGVDRLLLGPARALKDQRFVVAGAQYPAEINWPDNVELIEHLPPGEHARFYCAQRYTLNVTRADMAAIGYSPSVRLFEAAACGVPLISDRWPGIDAFFEPEREIFLADSGRDVCRILTDVSEERRLSVAEAARRRVLASHTADRRAAQLEAYYAEVSRHRRGTLGVEAVA